MTSAPDEAITQHSCSGDGNSTEDASEYSEEEAGMSADNNDNESDISYPTVSRTKYDESVKKFKKLFCVLNDKYPVKFKVRESVVPYYAAMEQTGGGEARVPHLLLKPVLKGSWLDPPDKYHVLDNNKIWNNITTLVPKVSRTTPRTFALAAGPACPFYSVYDPDLKRFLNGKPFKKIELDHTLFDKSSVDVGSSPHSPIDAILRKALTDSFLNDELFTLIFDIAGSFVPHLNSTPLSSSLETLFSSLRICAENNQRSGESILDALVCNRVALRDVVLRRFSVPDTSRALLRGSDFKSDSLFGPLPELFRETLLHPMGNVYKCTSRNKTPPSSKATYSKSTFSKKRSGTSGSSSAKRFKPSTSSSTAATSAAAKNFRSKFRKRK